MAYKTVNIDVQITRKQIEDTMNDRGPRRYYYRLSEFAGRYPPLTRVSKDDHDHYLAEIRRALLAHDHKYGVNALPRQTTVYRVALHPGRDDIEVVSIGMERVDTTPDTVYANFSKLPAWMQEKLQVMIMLDDTAPTEHIEGLGRRISKYVFWLEIPAKENDNG